MREAGAAALQIPFYPDPEAPLPADARFSFAQNWEDAYLNRVFGGVETGFYIDVGAWDPTRDSVTRLFYDRGWTGINLEPGKLFETLASARPRDVNLPIAVAAQAGKRHFRDLCDATGVPAGTSHLEAPDAGARQGGGDDGRGREVEVRPLADVISEHAADREIHFLKIDVEGAEREVLVSNDWTRFRPWIVLVEATFPGTPETCHELWEDVLIGAGYVRAFFDGLNMYYCRDDKAEFVAALDRPINVFDGFRQFDPEVAEVHAVFAEAMRRMSSLVTERDAARAERDAASGQRDAIIVERDGLHALMEAAVVERDQIAGDRDAIHADRDRLHASWEVAVLERDRVAGERDAVLSERDRLVVERNALLAERDRSGLRHDAVTERLLRLQTRYRLDGTTRELRFGLWLARRLRRADTVLARLVGRKHLALRPMKARFLATAPGQQTAPAMPATATAAPSPERIPLVVPKLDAVIAEIHASEARSAARERATAEGLEAVLLALAARASKS